MGNKKMTKKEAKQILYKEKHASKADLKAIHELRRGR